MAIEPDNDVPGGVILTAASRMGKELAKWEQFPTSYTGVRGPGNPYQYRMYPKMLYKAHRRQGGVIACMDPEPHPDSFIGVLNPGRAHELACAAAERFTASCQRIVQDQAEESRAHEDGWRESPEAAIQFVHERDRTISTAAAERAYTDARMSPAAQAEAKEAEKAHDDLHLPAVPEKRRGRSSNTSRNATR